MAIEGSREKAKEALRTRIVEAARDIVSEEGLDALSMRALAERIAYSPATIYLYFRDKEELLREVVAEGFRRLGASVEEQTGALDPDATAAVRHRAIGRAYALFALDHTAYFRVMFEIPGVAQMRGDGMCAHEERVEEAASWCQVVDTVQQAMDEGSFSAGDAQNAAVIGWGLVHGLTSLYLSGHLMKTMQGREAFIKLLEEAMTAVGRAWAPVETGEDRSS